MGTSQVISRHEMQIMIRIQDRSFSYTMFGRKERKREGKK